MLYMYELSPSSFFIGLLIIIAGVAFVRFHQVIADNLGSGVASYDRYKLYAFITCGLGFLIMTNLHVALLTWFFGSIFGR